MSRDAGFMAGHWEYEVYMNRILGSVNTGCYAPYLGDVDQAACWSSLRCSDQLMESPWGEFFDSWINHQHQQHRYQFDGDSKDM